MRPASVDACVTDPPYGLSFMGRAWDHGVPGVEFWEAVLRVLKPGAPLLAFGGTRTYHRLTCAIEDAGFEIRDCLSWLYGTGFPKSLDIGKAIDKQRYDRAEILQVTTWIKGQRDRVGLTNKQIDDAFAFNGMAGHWTSTGTQPSVPTLDQVPQLLKVLGLSLEEVPETIRDLLWTLNGRKGQPGAAWFDREVLRTEERTNAPSGLVGLGRERTPFVRKITAPATDAERLWDGWGTALKPAWEPIVLAMKPLDGTFAQNAQAHGVAGLNVNGCRLEGGQLRWSVPRDMGYHGGTNHLGAMAESSSVGRWPANVALDEVAAALLDEQAGGASRFFYCAKASAADRHRGGVDNRHPTVKPHDLMRWLCRLVKMPGGTVVLDPFMGSGSTGVAAVAEGMDFVGIDLDPGHVVVARARIASSVNPQMSLL